MSKFIVEIQGCEEEAIKREIGHIKWKTGVDLTVSQTISKVIKEWTKKNEKIHIDKKR